MLVTVETTLKLLLYGNIDSQTPKIMLTDHNIVCMTTWSFSNKSMKNLLKKNVTKKKKKFVKTVANNHGQNFYRQRHDMNANNRVIT